ncbi:hypothetical protein DFJ74DRAFT_690285 [Hyaloraphidium curvatum]|nr:hypothetical protein DFJ74DRAFT_690285 [Hyaloraphidium curvatum]
MSASSAARRVHLTATKWSLLNIEGRVPRPQILLPTPASPSVARCFASRKMPITLNRASKAVVTKPISQRIEWLFDVAAVSSAEYCSPASYVSRKRYRSKYPTEILALKCMDGRINLAVATNTPPGIFQPFRNLGGRFHLGWPHLGETIVEAVDRVVSDGRRVIIIATYHFSKGDVHRGCAGFNYDTDAARRHTFEIKSQIEEVFGGTEHSTVYPLVCGFETDEDALILHGRDGDVLNMADLDPNTDRDTLRARLATLLPDAHRSMIDDLVPVLAGNLEHVAEMRARTRTLDVEHREWAICIGRGFDWLHAPNTALIVGPYSPDLDEPIRRAAGIIKSNMDGGRIPSDGFLLLASSPYDEVGVDKARAVIKSRFLLDFAAGVIRRSFPELADKMHVRTCVMSWATRSLEIEPHE